MQLDCHDQTSTAASLCRILNLTTEDFQCRLQAISTRDFNVQTDITLDRWIPMIRHFAQGEIKPLSAGRTCWFHATRVADPKAFQNGLRSLTEQLDESWGWLHSLVADVISSAEWTSFRKQVEMDHYGHRKDTYDAWRSEDGPCAFLMPARPLSPGSADQDYFRTSELVDFIGAFFDKKFPFSLRERHMAATTPYLVKFTTPGIQLMHLGAALDYLLLPSTDRIFSGPTYSGRGKSVPANDILAILPVIESRRKPRAYHI